MQIASSVSPADEASAESASMNKFSDKSPFQAAARLNQEHELIEMSSSSDISDPARVIAKGLVDHSSRDGFLRAVVPALLHRLGANAGGVISQSKGNWRQDFWDGESASLPEVLIGESIDLGSPRVGDSCCVVPFPVREANQPNRGAIRGVSAMVMKFAAEPMELNKQTADLQQWVAMLAAALDRLDLHQYQCRRVNELSAILAAAATWQRIEDDEALLRAIADTATSLLSCERASIFLWDRRRSKLIGRPALGVEHESLEVDDDAGVVGEVLATGESKIWNSGSDDVSRVNRKVDARTDFQTRSLVAVPMASGRSGSRDGRSKNDLIGVFEAINAIDHDFEIGDVAVLSDLATHAAVAIESLRTRRKLKQNRDRLVDDAAAQTELIGTHASIDSVRKNANKIAGTDLSVLVLGKNGTGKEVLARMIHYQSKRRNGPFVAVNCAALVETLLESELFGHEKGAFTDANQSHSGKFEMASGGTLFLDEVGDMSTGGQAKLLRVLEDKVVVRVGGSQSIPVDVRVIAATNQPLEELIEQRRFREDLFFRLNVVSLTLPPLAARGDDVLLLAEHFLQQFCYQIGRKVPQLNEATKSVLRSHAWPGNIRQLRNTIERVCYLCSDDEVQPDDLMLSGGSTSNSSAVSMADLVNATTLTEATKEFQVEHIQAAIEACGGNMTDAAARLGLHRSNLYRKMRQLGMPTSGE
jgi:DNA-binding NtrC family response regulator